MNQFLTLISLMELLDNSLLMKCIITLMVIKKVSGTKYTTTLSNYCTIICCLVQCHKSNHTNPSIFCVGVQEENNTNILVFWGKRLWDLRTSGAPVGHTFQIYLEMRIFSYEILNSLVE